MSILVMAFLATALPGAGQDSPRLTRPIEFPDDGSLPDGATAGQLTVAVYDRLQVTHGAAYRTMGEAFVCRSADAKVLAYTAREAANRLPRAQRDAVKSGNWSALTAVATDTIGMLDGVDPARIRADEAIGPGVYNPSITIVAYTIRRCRFY